jgi:hypothetical protein
VRRNGGAQGRPGSSVINPIKDSTKTVRLIPFIYSQQVTYMMEFGNKYIRFYQNGEPYQAQGIGAYSSGTGYTLGSLVSSGGINYYCCFSGGLGTGVIGFNQNPLLLGDTFANYESGALVSTGMTPSTHASAWYPLSGTVYEIPTPWAYTDLPNLRFDQTGNDIVITHSNYSIMRLTRTTLAGVDAFWLFHIIPSSLMLTTAPSNNQGDSNVKLPGSAKTCYAVTAVSATGDENALITSTTGPGSLIPGEGVTTTDTIPTSTPISISWTAIPNAVSYNIYYLNTNSNVFGFIGETTNDNFVDNGITPDYSNPWLDYNNILATTNNRPSACCFDQQRTFYGNTNNNPTTVWGSQTGLYDNFNIHVPTVDTDSLSFKMVGAQDVVQHLLSLGTLLVFTYGTINSINGDASGAITPSAINPHRETVHGASNLRPLIVGEFALYNQSQGSIVRDLGFNFQVDGYRGDDLTVFATHLFDNYTIADWSYQSIPHSVVWAVRSDGTLLSLTYVREQQILAWAHHDTAAGFYENVCCIPEGNQVSVYVVANRLINGQTVRFIERFFNQTFSDIRDFVGMDCSTTIDGRNTTTDTVTISGGTNWNETELLTLTLSANNFLTFTSADATNGNGLFVYDSDGNLYRFKITAYSSATVVQGFVDRQLPVELQGAGTTSWSHAIVVVSGLGYLQGQNVSVFADGCVVGSPNNSAYPVYTVNGSGQITLDKPYAVIQVGLPFITDIETLDIDTPGSMDNLGPRDKFVGEVTIYTVNSRSFFVGGQNPDTDLTNTSNDPLFRLSEQKLRQFENYSPMNLQTGKHTENIQGMWDQNGHVFIRHVDPTPILISAISPDGLYPMRAG